MTRTDAEKAREYDQEEQIRRLIGALSFIHGYADSAAINPVIHTNDYHREGYKLLAEKAQSALNDWREMVTLKTQAVPGRGRGDEDGNGTKYGQM